MKQFSVYGWYAIKVPMVVSPARALVKDGAPSTIEPTIPFGEHVDKYVLTVAAPDGTVHALSV